QILLNSRSADTPNGLGNEHGLLGRGLMDHTWGAGVRGVLPGRFEEFVEYGRRPTGLCIPRFRNIDGEDSDADFVRGYFYQGSASRRPPQGTEGFGLALKRRLRIPGPWQLRLSAIGEGLPHPDNRVSLDDSKVDRFGVPQV